MYRSKANPQVVLRPQDLVVLLRLSLEQGMPPTYAVLGGELGLTASEVHAGLERAASAQLARKDAAGKATVVREALRMFVQHGARYCFPATRGEMTRGMPTVWPHKTGSVRGAAFYPLYPTVPDAATRNPALYELLVLFDAVRGGSPRERAIALQLLDERLAS